MAVEYLANLSRNTSIIFRVFQSNDTRVQFHLNPFTYSLYQNLKGILAEILFGSISKRNDKKILNWNGFYLYSNWFAGKLSKH